MISRLTWIGSLEAEATTRVFRPNGSRLFRLRFRSSDGRCHDEPLRTHIKEVAEVLARKRIDETERELAGLIAPKLMRETAACPIAELVAEFVAHLERAGRCDDHVRHNRHRLLALFADCRCRFTRDMTAELFKKWRERQTALSPKTQNEYLGHAAAFFNWLVRSERIERNPLASVGKVATAGAETFKRRALTKEEFSRFMERCGKRRLVYFVACCTGLRRGEMRQLLWSDIHLDDPEPFIELRPETTKNREGGRIPLLPALAALLREKRAGGVHVSGRVFATGLPRVETLAKDLAACGISVNDEALRQRMGTWGVGSATMSP